jgi:RNA polymerase sigma-70 factor (ECF subfamily)
MAEKPAAGQGRFGRIRQDAFVSKPATGDAVSTWFIREILPFERNLMAYLQHNWRNLSDLPDIRQEVYARVLESAQERLPDNPRHFLLVCARNLLIDLMRRKQVVPMESFGDFEALGVASGLPDADRLLAEREDIKRLESAMATLPPRTREAIALAYFQGLPGKEIARRMGITQGSVSELLAHGALLLGRILYGPSA